MTKTMDTSIPYPEEGSVGVVILNHAGVYVSFAMPTDDLADAELAAKYMTSAHWALAHHPEQANKEAA